MTGVLPAGERRRLIGAPRRQQRRRRQQDRDRQLELSLPRRIGDLLDAGGFLVANVQVGNARQDSGAAPRDLGAIVLSG
jgi:hypothetical protein